LESKAKKTPIVDQSKRNESSLCAVTWSRFCKISCEK